MKWVIFDLDGCLADDRWRRPLIDLAADDPWGAYHAECHKDPFINSHLICDLPAHFMPIIFTARPERFREQTERWLREVAKLIPWWIFMRRDDCRKTSPELKEDYLNSLFNFGVKRCEIVCAFDDREDVLAVYKKHGIRAVKTECSTEANSNAQIL